VERQRVGDRIDPRNRRSGRRILPDGHGLHCGGFRQRRDRGRAVERQQLERADDPQPKLRQRSAASVVHGRGRLHRRRKRQRRGARRGWNGTIWSIQLTPSPAGPANPRLSQVSCATAGACTAVGSYTNGSGTKVTLAQGWNGSSWVAQTTLNPAGATGSSLSGVSCLTATACTAVGAESTGAGNPPPDLALTEQSTGTDWSIQPTPSLGAGYDSVLSGVACLDATCMAVGYDYYNQGPQNAPLAELWSGTAWTAETVPPQRDRPPAPCRACPARPPPTA